MGVFVNTMAKTLLTGGSATLWVYKNGIRFSRGWFAFFAYKWSYNIVSQAGGVWMARGAAVGKP